jgi:hypothetical protein
MGSPRYIFKWMTDAEFAAVRAYAVQVATGGQVSSIAGGAKSAGYMLMDTADFMLEFTAEVARRGGQVPANKVYSDFRTRRNNGF